MKNFHLIARALILKNNEVLLAHEKGAENTFLPGGHIGDINIGESATTALNRELNEELNFELDIESFLGCVEADWQDGTTQNYEINLVFKATIKNLDVNPSLVSHEAHLEFLWSAIDDLEKYNLLPNPLQKLIRDYISGQKAIWWASSLS
jgi:ADP-ribose pyrophosphatase YjhB (NUDIX family)